MSEYTIRLADESIERAVTSLREQVSRIDLIAKNKGEKSVPTAKFIRIENADCNG
jgi:hypothetical protein